MPTANERHALLAKGRLLFDSCAPENDYACVCGYVAHNLAQGGRPADVMAKFVEWLRLQRDMNVAPQHAAAILNRLENAT